MFFSNSIANKKGFLHRPARFRACTGTGEAGEWHRGETFLIEGSVIDSQGGIYSQFSGAFDSDHFGTGVDISYGSNYFLKPCYWNFDNSRVVPTGPENVPAHIKIPLIIYLGMHV